MRLELFETRLAPSPGSDIWPVHQSTFSKYFLGHFINDRVSRDTSFPAVGVKRERRRDDRADWRDQGRSGSCTCSWAPAFSAEEEVKPPAESREGRNLAGLLRKGIKVWNSCYREQKWSKRRMELINL